MLLGDKDWACTHIAQHLATPVLDRGYTPNMSEQGIRQLLEDAWRLVFYRHNSSSDKVQLAKVT